MKKEEKKETKTCTIENPCPLVKLFRLIFNKNKQTKREG